MWLECSCCGKLKPMYKFSRNKKNRYRFGLQNQCKACLKTAAIKFMEEHPEYAERYDRSKLNRDWSVAHLYYKTYMHMVKRCYDPCHVKYNRYGGRGIRVCNRWSVDGKLSILGYNNFLSDMGYPPEDMIDPTIDRVDNDGDYELDNCQWLSRSDNSKKRWK